jgi:hypothetical protein
MKNAYWIKFSLVVLFAAATCAAADDKKAADKKKDNTATATTPAPALPLTIPSDAILNPDGHTYFYTDKQGKKWNYVKTAFGITRFPAGDQPAAAVPPDYSRIKVFDKGDTVRFERPGPLGPLGWEKKKSELTDEEHHIFDAWKATTQQNEKTQ